MKNFKPFNISAPIIVLLSILLFGCVKENSSTELISESEAILAVKNIVGESGTITVLSNHSNSAKQSMQIIEDTVKLISLKEFQSAFNSLSVDTHSVTTLILESPVPLNYEIESNAVKTMYEEGPRSPGLYRFTFLPKTGGNSSYFSNMNLSYNVGSNGEIIGAPTLYFSGLHLFKWQPAQTSIISFNNNTFTSTFAITGTTSFGIQLGGTTIGWSSNITFYITINNDELNLNPVQIYSKK
jgi:hypothetical protein